MAPQVSPASPTAVVSANEETPRVSVVVPAYNCAQTLAPLLASLAAQTYPHSHYEVIIVDDGSADDTAAAAERLLAAGAEAGQAGREALVGRVLRKANGGPASARNAGARASTAEVIAFIDADCVADPDWLEAVVGTLARAGAQTTTQTATRPATQAPEQAAGQVAGVGGPLKNVAPPGWVTGYLGACQFYRQRERGGVVDYLLTANVAFRRAALAQVGGFDERPGVWAEDADLSFRLKQRGYGLLLAQRGAVTHYGAPGTARGLWRELYRYGFGAAVLSQNWRNGRAPATELLRHGGAVALSPLLALRLWRRRRAGLGQALSYLPLIALEHTAFCWGVMAALATGARGRTASGGAGREQGERGV